MAIRKYLDLFLFSLCFSVLLRESYSQSNKDQKMSIWDNNDNNKLDGILDKDRFNLEWPTFPPDTFDHHKPQEINVDHFPEIYIFIIVIVAIFFVLVCICGVIRCFMQRERGSVGTIIAIVERADSPRSSPRYPLSRIPHPDSPHTATEFTNPISESSIPKIERPPRYDDAIRPELSGTGSFPEVHPSIPDTPPPQYDDHNAARY